MKKLKSLICLMIMMLICGTILVGCGDTKLQVGDDEYCKVNIESNCPIKNTYFEVESKTLLYDLEIFDGDYIKLNKDIYVFDGYYNNSNFSKKYNKDYSIEKDINVYAKFDKITPDTTSSLNDTLNKKPSEVNTIDAFVTAENLIENKDKYRIYYDGEITALGIKSTISSQREYDNGNCYLENSINGVQTQTEILKILSDNNTLVLNSNSYTLDEFEYINGFGIYDTIPYIVSNVTVLESTTCTVKENDLYEFNITLDNQYSTILYNKFLKRINASDVNTEFVSINLTFTIDENYNFQKIEVQEEYNQLVYGVLSNCKSSITYRFDYSDFTSDKF